MKNKKPFKKIVVGTALGVMLFGTGVYATTMLLNWTGSDIMVQAGIFIDQVTNKLIKSEEEKNKALTDQKELENQIKDLEDEIKQLEEEIQGKEDGWAEKDQQIIDLRNEIISKQNDIDHLTRELQRANDAADEIKNKLDNANSKLKEKEINIWN